MDLVLIGCCRKRGAFISAPPLASAHEPALPTTQSCSPKGKCHGYHKQSVFLMPTWISQAQLQHKHKVYWDTNRTMQTLPRIPHSCLHQRGENSYSHGLRNNLLILLLSGKSKSYPESLVKKIQRPYDCGLPPDPYGPSENKCGYVCEWVCVCMPVTLSPFLTECQCLWSKATRIRAGYITHCSAKQHLLCGNYGAYQ